MRYDELALRGGAPAFRPDPADPAYLLGTMARIDRAATLRGVRTVRDGTVIPLNAWVDEISPPFFGRDPLRHDIIPMGPGHLDETLDRFNPQASSQWDGLGHVVGLDGLFFPDATREDILAGRRDHIGALASRGIATRGVLIDLSDYVVGHGSYDAPLEIPLAVVSAAIEDAGAGLEPGDVLVVHTGFLDWYRLLDRDRRVELSRAKPAMPGIGHGADMVRMLWDAGLAAIVSDTPGVESAPVRDPTEKFHHRMIGNLGFWFGELWDLGALARRLQSIGRADFLLTSAPMRLHGAVGSPANALGIL